jgi:probable HAF family extracellular repeat protein
VQNKGGFVKIQLEVVTRIAFAGWSSNWLSGLTTKIRASVLLITLTSLIPVAHSQSTTLDYPGAIGTTVGGINNGGQIAGTYVGSNNFEYGFSYESGASSSISVPGAVETWTSGIDDGNQILGSYEVGVTISGFIYDGTTFTGIAVPWNARTEAIAISSDRTFIVGGYRYEVCRQTNHGFLYTAGTFTTIDYPGAVSTVCTGVNRNGTIVGWYVDSGGNMHGFLYNGGTFSSLDFPGAASSAAGGINDSGTIVGTYGGPTVFWRYFEWYYFLGYHGFVYSGGVFNSFDFPTGSSYGGIAGINNNGAIVGYYVDAANHSHGVLYPAGNQAYVNPKYLIMSVTYASPGGNASSFVSYQNTSLAGNTSMISKSFSKQVSTSINVSEGGGMKAALNGQITETQSTSWTQKTTSSNAVTVNKTSSTTFKTPGIPNVYSPVNHDYDIIWLWLNPVTIFTLPNTNIPAAPVIWNGYGYDLNDPFQDVDIWPIYVGYLNGDFGPLSAQDANALSRSWVTTQTFGPGQGPGITSADYPNILKADPFADNPYDANSGYILTLVPGAIPATSTDGRFTASNIANTTPQSIPYAQAPLGSTTGEQETYQLTNQTSTTATQTSDYTYMVGYGVDASIGYGLFANLDFKNNWSFTWENISQTQNINTSTQTSTAQITGPPCPATTAPCNPDYTEPHGFVAYLDNLYGTLMFWPNPYFSISTLAPSTNTAALGAAANYTISAEANGGYTGTSISLNVSGLPAGASSNQGTVALGSEFALIVSTTSATPTGSYPLTISATDGSLTYFAYATLIVKAPDFAVSSTPSSETVSAGNQAGPFTVTVTPQGSFPSPISFSCSGLPVLASCTFSPTTVTPNANTATSSLSITTTGRTASLTPPAFRHRPSPLYAVWLALPAMVLGTAVLATPKRRKLVSYALVCLIAGSWLSQAACGGGNSGRVGSGSTGGTPAGTYTITVTGIAGSGQHSTTVTLTVQ